MNYFVIGEQLLKDSDIPLLERLVLGPTDSVKIYIRDQPDTTPIVNPAHIPDDHSPTTEAAPDDTPLPEEVNLLLPVHVNHMNCSNKQRIDSMIIFAL